MNTKQSLEAAEQREASGNAVSVACAEAWEEAARKKFESRTFKVLQRIQSVLDGLPRPLPLGPKYGKAVW